MKITAELNNLRMSARKTRLVADAIRGKRASEAGQILRFLARRAALPIEKLLHSALANAKNNFQVGDADALVISELTVDGGPALKRRRPRAMGRAFPIKKRTSHIRLVLETSAAVERKKTAKSAIHVVGSEQDAETDGDKTRERHPVQDRERPKVETKPKAFSRRMFRRKAI